MNFKTREVIATRLHHLYATPNTQFPQSLLPPPFCPSFRFFFLRPFPLTSFLRFLHRFSPALIPSLCPRRPPVDTTRRLAHATRRRVVGNLPATLVSEARVGSQYVSITYRHAEHAFELGPERCENGGGGVQNHPCTRCQNKGLVCRWPAPETEGVVACDSW